MIDLEKEREAFKQKMLKDHYNYKKEQEFEINRYGDFSWIGTDSDFEIWQMCAEEKQDEITELKQKLDEAHKIRASWVEYSQKIESDEFVLLPRDKIEILWQDDDEPENFCSLESDLDCLGDGIDLNDIMTINKHYQANLKTEKLYGTWFAEFGNPKEKANFHVGTHQECLDIVAKNKAMIEAVEKDHE